MRRSFLVTSLVAAAVAAAGLPAPARAQNATPLAGLWTLNRALSELPRDIGFNPEWMTAATRGDGGQSTGSGGGGAALPPFSGRQQSYEDARQLQLLTDEARNPASRLTIVDTPAAVTITNELGQSRTLHPDGKQETIELQGVPVGVTSTRDGDRLVVVYRAGVNRELRYTYSPSATPGQLVVDVQFLERGEGDKARRVYEAGAGTPATASTGAGAPPAPGAPGAQSPPETFDQRPGAELRGLTSLGILVEDLSAQAIACGLSGDTLERALSKKLTDGGFTVRRNSDEDTYVYVNVMTSSVANGLCVSRYDAFLYTHATARLSYHDQPVLVQVSLIHRGGIGASAPSAHGAAVVRGLEGYLDLFVTQIHDANK